MTEKQNNIVQCFPIILKQKKPFNGILHRSQIQKIYLEFHSVLVEVVVEKVSLGVPSFYHLFILILSLLPRSSSLALSLTFPCEARENCKGETENTCTK